jgi:hypothetical protein
MPFAYDRSFYRIEYPERERPRFTLDGVVHAVIDCGERGLRYRPADGKVPEIDAQLIGTVRFRDGQDIPVDGVVVRTQGGDVALQFTGTGIPLAIILSEQRYLRRHYPGWAGKK